jgi:hypothetical protein
MHLPPESIDGAGDRPAAGSREPMRGHRSTDGRPEILLVVALVAPGNRLPGTPLGDVPHRERGEQRAHLILTTQL